MLNNLGPECKRITRFNLPPCFKNCVLEVKAVVAVFARTRVNTVKSRRKAFAISANMKVSTISFKLYNASSIIWAGKTIRELSVKYSNLLEPARCSNQGHKRKTVN